MREYFLTRKQRYGLIADALWSSLPGRTEIALPAKIITENAKILLKNRYRMKCDLSNYGPKTIYHWHFEGCAKVANTGYCRLYYRAPGITMRPAMTR